MSTLSLEIARRFHGPPNSGNGGYVAGRLAAYVEPDAEVRLRVPPPLEKPLRVEQVSDQEAKLWDGETLVAEAKTKPFEIEVPPCPDYDAVKENSRGYSKDHPFPSCFVCGFERDEGDGLRIFPISLGHGDIVAATWEPDASLGDADGRIKPEFIWSALDCPGAFPFMTAQNPVVLGSLSARAEAELRVGERYIALGWSLSVDGRKYTSGTALYSEAGELVARARAIWIEIQRV